MDPLTVFVLSVIGAAASDALGRRSGRVSDYYEEQGPSFVPSQSWIPMCRPGSSVTWWVEPGEAVWIEARYLRPISGNVFHSGKLSAVASAVRRGDSIDLYPGYGQVYQITPGRIAESIQYQEYDPGPPFTTGDPVLDQWLGSGEDSMDPRMLERLQRAVASRSGDLGQWAAVVRDGNHRTFGAILGGEPRVPVRLYDNDVQDLRESLRRGSLTSEQADLLQKAVADTGQSAYWMPSSMPPVLPEIFPSPSLAAPLDRLLQIRPQIAAAAQEIYDAWDPDYDEDGDPEVGGGGICDQIQQAMASVVSEHCSEVEFEDSGWEGDDHAALVVIFPTGEHFLVDIPPGVYERGGGYSWTKIPGVTIDPDDVVVERMD